MRKPNDWWIDWPPQLPLFIPKDIVDNAIRYDNETEIINASTVGRPYEVFRAGYSYKYVDNKP